MVPVERMPPTEEGGEPAHRAARKVAIATLVGTSTEWYDYFLYGTASALVFPKLFFPSLSPTAGTLAAFATFAVTFAVRPIGGALFGHFGDLLGRKRMLVLSVLLMGVGTFAIGVLPTYQSIGIWAPVLLVLLRIFQGFSVGGEYGGAITMALEYAPPGGRGFYAALPQAGNPVGLLLGTAMLYLFALLPEAQFLSWGWRLPFLLSIALVAVGLYVRLNISETELFRRVRDSRTSRDIPLMTLLRKYKKTMLLVILAPAALNFSFYTFSSWSLSYLTKQLHLPTSSALLALMIAAALDVLAQPMFGALSDRFGRRPVYVFGSAMFGLIAFPFFWLLDTGSVPLVVLAMILGITICHGSTYSTQASFFAELFGTGVRYSGLSVGYHLSSALLSGPGPFIAASLLALTGGTWPISLVIIGSAVISVVVTLILPETSRADIARA